MEEISKELKNIKCILVDIDNTLTNSQREITEYTVSVIENARQKGIYVILCSGRTNQYTVVESKICKASSIVISDNGALIYDYNDNKILYKSIIPKEIAKNVWDISLKNDIDCIINTVYSRYRNSKYKDNKHVQINKTIDDISEVKEDITQIVVHSEKCENLVKSIKSIEKIRDLEISNTNIHSKEQRNSYFIDLNIKGNSKGNAIKNLMNILHLNNEELICLGDSMNDISMFKTLKYSVAMKNAKDNVKEKASFVTEFTNDEDGVAKFIEKYILNGR